MQLEVGEIIDLEIKRLGINGEGIGFHNKLAVFVDNAIVKEKIKAEIISVSEKMAKAKLLEIVEKSEFRVEPECEFYNTCGGCQTSHIDYNFTLKLKRDMLIESIQRYTDINVRTFEIKQTIGMTCPFAYRNKSSLPVRKHNDKATVGLYNMNSDRIVYIDKCLVQSDLVNDVNKQVLQILDNHNIIPYKDSFKRGEIKYLVTRAALHTNQVQVTLVTHELTPKIFSAAKDILAIKNVVSVYESFNNSLKDGYIFGETIKLLEGKDYIEEKIGNYKFQLLPNSFFQLNTLQTEVLYEVIRKACKLSMKETVLDLFCGVGTISLYLSKFAKKIIGVEINDKAIINANNNAMINKVQNVEFINADVSEELPTLLSENEVDIIVFDPPRTGLGHVIIDSLLKVKVKKLIYVSCNPSTLAKDLSRLEEDYVIKSITPVDMFPNTSHVESVTVLELKK
ncbi:MAG: 23S rRNA (uracil(1939)-C(5))-methyltransferase RlmD [Anaeroplasmataceae bacterium]